MPYADNDVYNIVLNSLNKIAGTTNTDATYYFNYSIQHYKHHYQHTAFLYIDIHI